MSVINQRAEQLTSIVKHPIRDSRIAISPRNNCAVPSPNLQTRVRTPNSLLNRELTGNFADRRHPFGGCGQKWRRYVKGLEPNSLCNPNREFSDAYREFEAPNR